MLVPATVVLLSLLCLPVLLDGLVWAEVWHHIGALGPAEVGGALCLVVLSFLSVAGQERAVMAHLSMAVPRRRQMVAAAVAAAIAQTTGFGPVVGALVRRRMLPELSILQSAAISAGMSGGFFFGVCALLLLLAAPGSWGQAGVLAAVVVLASLATLLPGTRVFGLRKPNLIVMARFLGWLAVDLAAMCTAFWVLLADPPALLALAPVFLLSIGAGMASGSPAGLGPFEAGLAVGLPGTSPDALIAAILLFRIFVFVVPLVIGCVALVLLRPAMAPTADTAIFPAGKVAGSALSSLPVAEAQLARQGNLALVAPVPGSLWISGALPHSRVMLGDPVGRTDGLLRAVAAAARAEGRIACLYKCNARMAAAARRAGFRTIRVAREAVIDPRCFSTAGPTRSALRRKLSRATKAGVRVESPTRLPLHEMASVSRAWVRSRGGERGFSMGVWHPGTVLAQRVFTARGSDGRLLAFVTFHAVRQEWVLDLVRCRPDTPDGTMYLLVLAGIEAARAAGVSRLTLAAVPEPAFRTPGVLRLLPGHRRIAGLWQFKSAFGPRWERRYAAAPGRLALVVTLAEIALAVRFPAPVQVAGVLPDRTAMHAKARATVIPWRRRLSQPIAAAPQRAAA